MWVAFEFAKATHIFSAKMPWTVNILTTNELVKLTMLWTTGSWDFASILLLKDTFLLGLSLIIVGVKQETNAVCQTARVFFSLNSSYGFILATLTLSMLCKIFSRQCFEIFFLIFPLKCAKDSFSETWLIKLLPNVNDFAVVIMLSTLGKLFSRPYFEIFFLFFFRKLALTIHANFLLGDSLDERPKSVFWEK